MAEQKEAGGESAGHGSVGSVRLSMPRSNDVAESLTVSTVRWSDDDGSTATAVEIALSIGATQVLTALSPAEATALARMLDDAIGQIAA
ncbi:hypothetical protein GCM10009836_44320 [Pseudonocardia ailaonensis]|uniref:Uncharacterized protein n=2 Tax=Pseudonocardia ailaonensis TaxID=367279 RepID=A0ABN2NB33_9PSEU